MNEHQRSVVFSTGTSEYETPLWLFEDLHNVFNFTLDPCASDLSHMVAHYFTEEDDGLAQDWGMERVYINPPYSDCDVWVEAAKGHYLHTGRSTVVLIPARTDTRYWHEHIWEGASYILFIKGRLKFVNRMHPSYQLTKNWIEEIAYDDDLNGHTHHARVFYTRSKYWRQYNEVVGREWRSMPDEEDVIDAVERYLHGANIHKVVEDTVKISSAPFPSAVVMYTSKYPARVFDHIGKFITL